MEHVEEKALAGAAVPWGAQERATQREVGHVDQACAFINDRLDRLVNMLDQHEARIERAIHGNVAPATVKEEVMGVDSASSPLSRLLTEYGERIDMIGDRLSTLTNRVDL